MADRKMPEIPADLPEDWVYGQTVAPEGAEVGLSEQHGYNYLMKKVNECARTINEIYREMGQLTPEDMVKLAGGGEMFLHGNFDAAPHTIDVEEDRPAAGTRFVVGSSASGHTSYECDYLCDGTADEDVIGQALDALVKLGGGELLFLPGMYHLNEEIAIAGTGPEIITLRGMGRPIAPPLDMELPTALIGPSAIECTGCSLHVYDLGFQNVCLSVTDGSIDYSRTLLVKRCAFAVNGHVLNKEHTSVVDGYAWLTEVSDCVFNATSGPEEKSISFISGHGMFSTICGNYILANSVRDLWNSTGISCNSANGTTYIRGNTIDSCTTAISAVGAILFACGNIINNAENGINCGNFSGSVVIANNLSGIEKNGILGAQKVIGNAVSCAGYISDAEGIRSEAFSDTTVTNNFVFGFPIGIHLDSTSDEKDTKIGSTLSGNSIYECATGILLKDNIRILTGGVQQPLYSNHSLVLGNRILDSTAASIQIESRHGKCLISQNICPDAPIVDQGTGNALAGNITT